MIIRRLPAFALRRQRFEAEIKTQQYHQRRNQQARRLHTKTRLARYEALGIDITQIKSCLPEAKGP